MNYYNPNYQLNQPYSGNPYLQQQQPQQIQPQAPMTAMPPLQNPQSLPTLNGKIVDSEDVVKATEVPIGGYGIFPKADLSEIYIKSWNNNGTTSVITFKPVAPQEQSPSSEQQTQINLGEFTQTILQKISILEEKLDNVLTTQAASPQIDKRREVNLNGF